MPRHALIETELGEVTLVASDDALVGLYFPGHWHGPDTRAFGDRVEGSGDPVLAQASHQLGQYLAGGRREFDLPLAASGDAFQEQVWDLLRKVPYGQTTTYGALAARLGDRTLAQRVGKAVGRNPLCVFVPCHRVVGSDGRLTGYAGGLDRKHRLLELDGGLLELA